MTEREIRTLRDKIGTDPMMTDEEIEYIWMAMDRQEPMNPVIEQGAPSYYGGAGICRDYCGCPKCGEEVGRGDDKANYCPECGQKIDWKEE